MPKLAETAPGRPASARSGLASVEWICPACGSPYWGSSGAWGQCNGPYHGGPHCKFKWPRDLDWMYFVRRADGSKFVSPAEYESTIGPQQTRGVA